MHILRFNTSSSQWYFREVVIQFFEKKSCPEMLTSACIVFVSQARVSSCDWDWLIIKTHQKSQNAICTLPFKILQSVSTVTRDTFFAVTFLVEAAKIFWGKLFLLELIRLKEEQGTLNSSKLLSWLRISKGVFKNIKDCDLCFSKLYGTHQKRVKMIGLKAQMSQNHRNLI